MPLHEHDMNKAIARVLDGMRRGWRVSGERTQVLKAAGQRPDIVVRQEGRPPVLIENEFAPAAGVEDETRNRLGEEFQQRRRMSESSVAMRSPASLRKADNRKLDYLTADAEFDYALFSGMENPVRFPESGWLTGKLTDLAGFVYRASIPCRCGAGRRHFAGKWRATGRKNSGGKRCGKHPDFGDKNQRKILQQEYGEQTRRMAMTILVNALAFHDSMSQDASGILFAWRICGKTDPMQKIRRQCAYAKNGEKILDVDYWPIFPSCTSKFSPFSIRRAWRNVFWINLVPNCRRFYLSDGHDDFPRPFWRRFSAIDFRPEIPRNFLHAPGLGRAAGQLGDSGKKRLLKTAIGKITRTIMLSRTLPAEPARY